MTVLRTTKGQARSCPADIQPLAVSHKVTHRSRANKSRPRVADELPIGSVERTARPKPAGAGDWIRRPHSPGRSRTPRPEHKRAAEAEAAPRRPGPARPRPAADPRAPRRTGSLHSYSVTLCRHDRACRKAANQSGCDRASAVLRIGAGRRDHQCSGKRNGRGCGSQSLGHGSPRMKRIATCCDRRSPRSRLLCRFESHAGKKPSQFVVSLANRRLFRSLTIK